MDKIITLENNRYKLIKNYKDGFNSEEITSKYTDYFEDYDYIVGDYAYSKLRLKGFCNKKNKRYKKFNDFSLVDDYIKNDCAYECAYFILEKVNEV